MIVSLAARLAWPTSPGAFRLVLALVVFVHHFSSFGFGQYAVYVFFMLSGFWLHAMWVGRYRHARRPYLTYMVSRIWRLAPVMLLVSAFTIPWLLLIGTPASLVFSTHPAHLAFSSAFLLGYAQLYYPPVGSAWSLDVEMQFYLVAPLLAALLLRVPAWPVVLAGAVLSLVAAQGMTTPALPAYLVFFLIGMAVAARDWRPGRTLALGTALLVPAALVAITLSPWRGMLWGGASTGPLFAWNPELNIALALLTMPFAMYTVRQSSDGTDRMFADLSYIVYLAHWAGMQWFFTMAGRPVVERLGVAATCFVVVPLTSWLIWRFYDRPINRRRAAWVAGRLPPRPVPPSTPQRPDAAVALEPAAP